MKELSIKTSLGSYNIHINDNNFENLKKMVSNYKKVLILTNKVVENLYGEQIRKILIDDMQDIGKLDGKIFCYAIEDGEKYKTYKTAEEIYDFLISNDFYRDSLIITLGGGVVCDLGGYISATYMRGIDFVQIPTSLLAQVDASIGGKVAINYKHSKNIIGAFYHPKAVFINPLFLKTLHEKEFQSGMGEVIKHALLSKNEENLLFLENNYKEIISLDLEVLEEMIEKSCLMKKHYVEIDEKERGERVFLNLGHTYGHALESVYHFRKITHGEGVAKGIIYELDLFEENQELKERVLKLFEKYKIDWSPVHVNADSLIKNMKKDKKNIESKISFIKLKKIGELENKQVEVESIMALNDKVKDRYDRYVKAVIDVGTNSTRLFVSEVEKKDENIKIIKPIYKKVEITSLGKGLNERKILTDIAMDKTIQVIEEFHKRALNYGAVSTEAYATSAVRDAKNREYFLKRVQDLGINIQCIQGEIEAKLSFIGISSLYKNENIGIIDIGGGSTEVSIGRDESLELSKSFDVGAVRVTEMFFQNRLDEEKTEENYSLERQEEAKEWILNTFDSLKEFQNREFLLLGVAGTVSKQVTILEKIDVYDSQRVHGYILTLDNIEKNYEMLLGKTLEERMRLPGLEPKRAEYVIAGTLILKTLMKDILKKNSIIFSDTDNLEGSTIYFK